MSIGGEPASLGERPKGDPYQAASLAETLRRYLANDNLQLAGDWLENLAYELSDTLRGGRSDPPIQYTAIQRTSQIIGWIADGLGIPDDSGGDYLRHLRKSRLYRQGLEGIKPSSVRPEVWELDRATVLNLMADLTHDVLIANLTHDVVSSTIKDDDATRLRRLKLLVVILVILIFAGAPVAELRLPPELQSALANEPGYLALAIAIATAIYNYRKPPKK